MPGEFSTHKIKVAYVLCHFFYNCRKRFKSLAKNGKIEACFFIFSYAKMMGTGVEREIGTSERKNLLFKKSQRYKVAILPPKKPKIQIFKK